MEANQHLLTEELQIDSIAHNHLKEAAMWAKFLGIVGIVISILICIAAFFVGAFITTMSRSTPYGGTSPMDVLGTGFITVIYLIIGGIGFFLSLLLYRFGVRTKAALISASQDTLNAGLSSLKVFFRAYGIIMIIYLGFIALAFIAAIASAMFSTR